MAHRVGDPTTAGPAAVPSLFTIGVARHVKDDESGHTILSVQRGALAVNVEGTGQRCL